MRFLLVLSALLFIASSCTKLSREPEDMDNQRIEDMAHSVSLSHTSEFRSSRAHGQEYFKNKALCARCHGFDFSGGQSNVACKTCHNYPHAVQWALPKNHGKTYLESLSKGVESEDNPSNCLNCHGDRAPLKEENPTHFVSCASCHIQIPHTHDFKGADEMATHGEVAETYAGKCTQCHTDLKRLLPNIKEGCLECHDGVPTVKWEIPKEP